eukprot:scaffold27834_cov52-Phaeocystis_antarctica.AAC.1
MQARYSRPAHCQGHRRRPGAKLGPRRPWVAPRVARGARCEPAAIDAHVWSRSTTPWVHHALGRVTRSPCRRQHARLAHEGDGPPLGRRLLLLRLHLRLRLGS